MKLQILFNIGFFDFTGVFVCLATQSPEQDLSKMNIGSAEKLDMFQGCFVVRKRLLFPVSLFLEEAKMLQLQVERPENPSLCTTWPSKKARHLGL